jgi:hypothetical protein
MTTELLTPDNLTWEHIKAWSGPDMKKYMAGPLREKIYEIVASRQLSEVEAVATQQAEPQPTPEEQEAQRIADETRVAEEKRVADEAAAAEAAKNKKIVIEYQVRDEKGDAIGRPTHLEAATNEEMIEKMKEAHIQATRAFHRLKQQKVQSLRDINNPPAQPVPQMTDAELLLAVKDLKSDDPNKALEAHRKLNKAEADRIKAEADQRVAAAEVTAQASKATYEFLQAHRHDYNNCKANASKLEEYFKENDIPWTLGNLEIAFLDLKNDLAPVVEPEVPVRTANPTPTVTPVTTPAAATVVQTPTAPVTPALPANPVTAQSRPGVNGGIVPGQNSAPRPTGQPQGLTMAEIHSWDGPTMRAKMRIPSLRAEIERVIAASQSQKRK